MNQANRQRESTLFNSPIEIGLRALALLTESFPDALSLQRLVAYDYLVVHSDDVPDGPPGLHPQTPHRGGELTVRRTALRSGLLLYHSRGLIARQYSQDGVLYAATETSAAFLDALEGSYIHNLRARADWLNERFAAVSDSDVNEFVRDNIIAWGSEFEMESALYEEGAI